MLSHRALRAACRRTLYQAQYQQSERFRILQFAQREAVGDVRVGRRHGSSSARWKTRQGSDIFAREAKVQGLKSRAAFKLLEIDAKYKLFKKGQTVIDLGYAPGSWSQVVVECTKPTGRVIGIDIIPAQPPKGVSTIQGNFLSKGVQEQVKRFLLNSDRSRPRQEQHYSTGEASEVGVTESPYNEHSYIETGCQADLETVPDDVNLNSVDIGRGGKGENDDRKTVDVVLSDMSAPFDQVTGFWKRSLTNPYIRMMNTSGINFKDHAGSMDLCAAALQFSRETLKVGGHFVCKFYQGAEDKEMERHLKEMFAVVHREKPESSRSESKEAYFVALRRKKDMAPKGSSTTL